MKKSLKRKNRKYRKYTKRKSYRGGSKSISLPKEYDKDEVLKKMKNISVIFCGTVRNVEGHLEKNIQNLDKCGEKFKSYGVIIYENDSTDKTRDILNKHKKDNYHYIFEDNVKEHSRTKRLSHGRNMILNKVKELNKNNSYDFMIILDLDDINSSGKFIESIESCFLYDDWDVLSGNQSGQYYDIWALRKKGDVEYDCMKNVYSDIAKGLSNFDIAYKKYAIDKMKNYPSGNLHEVDSAFGGIAIYRLKSVPDECSYNGTYEDGGEICEHVPFHQCLKKHGKKLYMNTSFLTN